MNNRPDIFAKVTGKAMYVNDISLPGMVYAKLVRSPISSGKILSIGFQPRFDENMKMV